jgi:prephenate dehydrogenase
VLTKEHRGSGIPLKMGRLVLALGAKPATLTAARHDRILARTSHAPYLVSCALVKAALADGIRPAELRRFSAGGWLDMTRLATSNQEMAVGYVQANQREVVAATRILVRELKRLKPAPGVDALARHVRRHG